MEQQEALNQTAPNSAFSTCDEPVVVGREQELARFRTILQEGHPLLMVITGGPGVGKSSLLHAFQAQAVTAGWTAAPGSASECLRITPETTEESFIDQVQNLIAVLSDQSFIEKSPAKTSVEGSAAQPPLLPIVEQLRFRAPLLLLIDGYQPEPAFAEWFQTRFVKEIKDTAAPVIVVVSERPDGATKLTVLAEQIVTLGVLEEPAIRKHFETMNQQISPRMTEDELNIYVDEGFQKPEMIGSLTRVLRLALSNRT